MIDRKDRAELRALAEERNASLYAATVEQVEQELAADPLLHFTSVHEEAMRRLKGDDD